MKKLKIYYTVHLVQQMCTAQSVHTTVVGVIVKLGK